MKMGLDDEISTFKYPVSSANHEAHVNMYFWKIFDESILFKSLFKIAKNFSSCNDNYTGLLPGKFEWHWENKFLDRYIKNTKI